MTVWHRRVGALLAAVVLMSGCAGSSDEDDSAHDPPSGAVGSGGGSGSNGGDNGAAGSDDTLTRSGQAIDGYLLDAKVCVDANGNRLCDPGEPSARTRTSVAAKGAFTITGIDLAHADAPTLVVAQRGTTVDSDSISDSQPRGRLLAETYTLTAPAPAAEGESTVVTPLSSLVQSAMVALTESGSQGTVEERRSRAITLINGRLQQLGVELGELSFLGDDYLAIASRSGDSPSQSAAARASRLARALSGALRRIRAQVQQAIEANTAFTDNHSARVLAAAKSELAWRRLGSAVGELNEDLGSIDPEAVAEALVGDFGVDGVSNQLSQTIEDLRDSGVVGGGDAGASGWDMTISLSGNGIVDSIPSVPDSPPPQAEGRDLDAALIEMVPPSLLGVDNPEDVEYELERVDEYSGADDTKVVVRLALPNLDLGPITWTWTRSGADAGNGDDGAGGGEGGPPELPRGSQWQIREQAVQLPSALEGLAIERFFVAPPVSRSHLQGAVERTLLGDLVASTEYQLARSDIQSKGGTITATIDGVFTNPVNGDSDDEGRVVIVWERTL